MSKASLSDRILIDIFCAVLVLFAAACCFPFLVVLSSSMTDELSIVEFGYNLLPRKISFDAYALILKAGTIGKAYGVTIFVTVVGTLMAMVVTIGMAYALASRKLRYAGIISFMLYFTILFSGGLVSFYILIVKYLGLKNTLWALILPGILSPWFVYMLRNFFRSVPGSLLEAARIDGANDLHVLLKIVLPISVPALASIGLFYAMGFWNEWFRALLFIEEPSLYPLQYIMMAIIRNIDFAKNMMRNTNQDLAMVLPSYSARMATTILTIGPIILLYPFLQKYFVKGLMMGGVKE